MAEVRVKNGMKILQITNKVPVPPKDGGSIASFRLAEGLAAGGHEVHLLAMNTSKHFIEESIIKGYEKKNITIRTSYVNTRINPFRALSNLLFSRLPYNAVRFISRDFREKLITSLISINPDIIILENLYPALYLKDIRSTSISPVVYRAHNVESEIWQRAACNARSLRKWYLKILARRIKRFETGILNKYDFLVPITERDALSLNKLGNTKPVYVLPTGFPLSGKPSAMTDSTGSKIAHLGALDWLPNQEGLLWFIEKVLPRLRKIYPDIEFHLAGRNAPQWLEKRISVDGVIYHGEITDARKFIESHQIHIVPLFSGSGMRIKILEAMALGKTIVTTSLGTEGIDTRNDQNILIADNVDDFTERVLKGLEDPVFCREIGENAFTFVSEKLNNDKLVTGLLDFLKKNL